MRTTRIAAAACAAWMLCSTPAARAEDAVPLRTVVERAIAYDPQVREAEAKLQDLRTEREEPVSRRLRATDRPVRPVAPDPAAATSRALAVAEAEGELHRLRERVAGRATIAALEWQRQQRLVELAQRSPRDTQRLAQARSDRLAAQQALESIAGALPLGVAPFDGLAPLEGGTQEQIAVASAEAAARVDAAARSGQLQRGLAEQALVAEAAAAPKSPDPHADPALDAALRGWLAAWRAKDVGRYLASYAHDFEPNGMSRDAWLRQRRQRLSQPGPFDISISGTRWAPADAGTVEVRFVQRFRSKAFADTVAKRLLWRKGAQGWAIAEERTETHVASR